MNEFIDYLKKRQFSNSTLNTSRVTIGLYLKWLEIENMEPEQIGYQDLLGFMKYCSNKGTSQRTIQHYLNTIKHFYEYLEEEGKIVTNPVLWSGSKRRETQGALPHPSAS